MDGDALGDESRLEQAIADWAGKPSVIRQAFRDSTLFALGHTVDGGASSDLLHFTVDDDAGKDSALLPVFTRTEYLAQALVRNTDWQQFEVLEIEGQDLDRAVDPGVSIIVNPWTSFEYRFPPRPDPCPTESS